MLGKKYEEGKIYKVEYKGFHGTQFVIIEVLDGTLYEDYTRNRIKVRYLYDSDKFSTLAGFITTWYNEVSRNATEISKEDLPLYLVM